MAESSRYLFDPERLSDQEQSRLHNLEQIKAAGIDPFPARVRRTHTIAQARLFDGDSDPGATVSVCGRLKRIRIMGKMSFADLEDGSGQIQIVVRRDNLPDGWYNDIWKNTSTWAISSASPARSLRRKRASKASRRPMSSS